MTTLGPTGTRRGAIAAAAILTMLPKPSAITFAVAVYGAWVIFRGASVVTRITQARRVATVFCDGGMAANGNVASGTRKPRVTVALACTAKAIGSTEVAVVKVAVLLGIGKVRVCAHEDEQAYEDMVPQFHCGTSSGPGVGFRISCMGVNDRIIL